MKKLFSITKLLFLLPAGFAMALPEWSVDFREMPVDEPPITAVATPGVVNSYPTSYRVDPESGESSVIIRPSFKAGGAELSDQPAVFTYHPGETLELQFAGAAADVAPPEDFYIAFDLLVSEDSIHGTGSNTLEVRLINTMEGASNLLRLLFMRNGDIRLLSDEPYEVDVVAGGAWSTNEVQKIEGRFSSEENLLTLSVNGVQMAMVNFDFPYDEAKTVRTVRFRYGSNNLGWSGAINNFQLLPAPPAGR